jgi:sugar phosphate isomerase/epimerase
MTDRRNFLKSALPLGLGLGVLPLQDVFGAQNQNFDKSSSSKIKVGLNAWSYYVQLYKYQKGEAGGMSLFDMLEECARLEFDAVDPTGYFFPGYPNRPERKFINEFKQRAFQLGLGISGTGIRNDFATADKAKRNADIALAKVWIEVAAEMGAPVLRVFAGVQPKEHTWDETSVWMAEALAECAEYGKQFGVMVGVQNHGDMLKSADEVIKILEIVDSDWLGTIVDTGFFLTPDPYADIARVIPYAVNWQVKELLSDRKGGKIDMNKLVAIIRDSNYRGYVPIETLPDPDPNVPYDAMTKVPELLGDLRKALY